MVVITILALILAIAATVLAFIFIVPEKKSVKSNAFLKLIHDIVNFKFLIIEKIFQALYIFATAYVITYGFCMLFYVQPGVNFGGYALTSATWYGGYGLLIMILGPIAVRLVYEVIMMFILLIKNVIQINSKLKNENGTESGDIFSTPKMPMMNRPKRPAPAFCRNCGTKAEQGSPVCTNCGAKLR